MLACDICKVASECAAWKTDERNPEPQMYLSACNYRSADEYIECMGEYKQKTIKNPEPKICL